MNSREIKVMDVIGYDNSERLVGKDQGTIDMAMAAQRALLLKEIAYQLAVLNERDGQ